MSANTPLRVPSSSVNQLRCRATREIRDHHRAAPGSRWGREHANRESAGTSGITFSSSRESRYLGHAVGKRIRPMELCRIRGTTSLSRHRTNLPHFGERRGGSRSPRGTRILTGTVESRGTRLRSPTRSSVRHLLILRDIQLFGRMRTIGQ